MTATNDFIPFATGGDANVESQSDYIVDPTVPIGNQPGIASSALNNKALRQATYIASQIAQFLVNQTGESCLDDATPANIQALMTQVWPAPTGTVMPFTGSTAPTGFLLAHGQAISRTTYAALFAVCGTTYGVGDGSTTFNLPNLQGIFPVGAGSQTFGGKTYSATLGAYTNDTTAPNGLHDTGHSHGLSPGAAQYYSGYDAQAGGSLPRAQGGDITGTTTSYASLSGDSQTAPAAVALNYIIKT